MSYLKSRFSVFAIAAALVGCKAQLESLNTTAYIIANNDIVPLEKNNAVELPNNSIRASVLIATWQSSGKVKFCSGALLSPKQEGGLYRILSNHHCFASVDDKGKSEQALIPESCTNTRVIFEFSDLTDKPTAQLNCVPGSLVTNQTLDLSVFNIAGELPEGIKPLEFWNREEVPADREAYIVHYPDIQEHYKNLPNTSVQLPKASITTANCKVFGRFAEDEWALDPALPTSLRHSCDLKHGSSGSALFDKETNTIIGVNWGGVKISASGAIRTDNVATASQFVEEFLLSANGEIKAVNIPQPSSLEAQRASNEQEEISGQAKSASKDAAKKIATKQCAVVGLSDANSNGVQQLMLFLLFFAPLVLTAVLFGQGSQPKFAKQSHQKKIRT